MQFGVTFVRWRGLPTLACRLGGETVYVAALVWTHLDARGGSPRHLCKSVLTLGP
jgi:hypothetical protein